MELLCLLCRVFDKDIENKEMGSLIFSNGITEENLKKLGQRFQQNITHTQSLAQFQNLPGKDPWGKFKKLPSYKALTPQEMFAEGKLSNNIATGKCWTIAELRYAILKKNGIDEKDIFILRSNKLGHEICIFKFQSEIYITDNQRIKQISKLSPEKKDKYAKRPVSWFYWETFFSKSNFTLDFEKIHQTDTLYEYLEEVSKDQWKIQDLKERIPESDMDELVKYWLQDTEVRNFQLYISAFEKWPLVKELATKLHNRNDIYIRIRDNIKENTSIFSEKNRIMSPDQVIVFKQWTARDRAMLGHILSNLLHIPTKIAEENKIIYDKKEYMM